VIQARPFINLHDRLWENLKKTPQFKDAAANQPLTLRGSLWRIELDARQPERKVKPVAAVFERLKTLFGKRFWELISFPVTPIDSMLGDDEKLKSKLIETHQAGSRKILSITPVEDSKKAA